ncbi:MAG: hypothetical protein EOO22_08370 [Comamonadaceae bacterium]|nr:MAG: hypothetical protein EOO22_08370 [Comamonadaceae bacterium]
MTISSFSLVTFTLLGIGLWRGRRLLKPAFGAALVVTVAAISGLWDRFDLPYLRLQWEPAASRAARLADERKMKRLRAPSATGTTGTDFVSGHDGRAGSSEVPHTDSKAAR